MSVSTASTDTDRDHADRAYDLFCTECTRTGGFGKGEGASPAGFGFLILLALHLGQQVSELA
jgi:hypothetical protein